jgi:DNA topoisomerase-1
MPKSLVIVESPGKAKTINKFLGKDFIVKSSIGHVRDLPVGQSKQKGSIQPKTTSPKNKAKLVEKLSPEEKKYRALVDRMGVDPKNHWRAEYAILPGKEKVVSELKKLADEADSIYLATDLDREGEAIAWHLQEILGGDLSRYRRVVFNEITKTAIQEAFLHPSSINQAKVEAQQTRRFLDRVVGFMLSPLLWGKIARGLSAGRVQSVAVRLVVEREREIRAFIPEVYWELFADTQTKNSDLLRLQVVKFQDTNFRPKEKSEIDTALGVLKNSVFQVQKLDEKTTYSKPSAPFITSTLQQVASTRLGFGVKKTMTMAQRLYEAGLITYMRTDSTNLSQEAVANCRTWIEKTQGKNYLPEAPNKYSSKNNAQEAHEAIRPSDVRVLPKDLDQDKDAKNLYDLIWRRFVACQMQPAVFSSQTLTVKVGDYELRAKGRVLIFDGHLKINPQPANNEEDILLPHLKVGDVMDLKKLDPKKHLTKPPARFNEASLVKELEKKGIGRPSTYASIISTIQDRGYVKQANKRFYAEKIGEIVTDRLQENFLDLMDYDFTANMESTLDLISEGQKDWIQILDAFYADFSARLKQAESEQGMRINQPVQTPLSCKVCQRPMMIRTGSTGVFLGCSGYALPPNERCKETMNLAPDDLQQNAGKTEAEDELAQINELQGQHRCPKCQTAMNAYLLDGQQRLHICGQNPDCDGVEIEQGEFLMKGYEGPSLECDKCQSPMQLKSGRFGPYFGCTNEACKNTRKVLKNGEAAPPKADAIPMPHLKCQKHDDYYILRDGASGLFLAASQFPKFRETRAPLVQELISVKDQLDPKYHFLLSAPLVDSQKRPAIVRFSRKLKVPYVMTEVDGKASGWQAYFEAGRWIESDTSTKQK